MDNKDINNYDDYLKQFNKEIQDKLNNMREIIKKYLSLETTEKISWGMPTFYLYGNLVHFAAAKNHIGFYPGESGIKNFIKEFDKLGLKYSKGALQLPYNKPFPIELIQKIVIFRSKENLAKKFNKLQ